jgi:hypothetical protein
MGGGAGIMTGRSTEESMDEYTGWTDVYHWAGVDLQVRCRLVDTHWCIKLRLCTITILLIRRAHSEGFAQKGEAAPGTANKILVQSRGFGVQRS